MKLLSKLFIISFIVSNLFISELSANDKEETIELNFVNTPISHLTQLVSEVTGNNFISDGTIPGNFTFVSQKPVKKKNLISIYEMILRTKGFMIVNHEDKDFFMIKRSNNARKENTEFNIKGNNHEIKTEVITLKYFTPSKIKPIIQPYFTTAGKVVANDTLGFIMLTDYFDSIQKIKKIIKRIDTPTNLKIHWVKLKNVNIKNVFPQITKLAKLLSTQFRKPIQVIEDKSTNSVIISCQGEEYKALTKLIKKIDKESEMSLISEVIYLKNSKAADLAKIITTMDKSRYEKGDIKEREKVSISHDVSLNAIILMGEKKIISGYQSIIDDLDKPKKQVYVEAKIIEVYEDRAKEIGVELDNLFGGAASTSGAWGLGVNLQNKVTRAGMPTLSGLPGILDVRGFSLGAAINLLEKKGLTNTLSRPKLLCLDNQESSIYVGNVQPILKSTTTSTSTTAIPTSTYTYKDIGLTLKIKPQIMNDNKVRLDIVSIVEDVVAGSTDAQLPITTKREIKTTSIVNNKDGIVIAGLIRKKKTITKSKTPFFGDIPLLGALFRNEESGFENVNLMVIITPTVINSASDLPAFSSKLSDKLIPRNLSNIVHENNITKIVENLQVSEDKKEDNIIIEPKAIKNEEKVIKIKAKISQDEQNRIDHQNRLKAMGIL